MSNFLYFVSILQAEVPLEIKYKDESWEMRFLNVFVRWFNPTFMTSFTTVIGYTVYFTNRKYVRENQTEALQILMHEAVHLLDTKRFTFPVFAFGYLFPQILVVFALLFPISPYFFFFLLFILPLPAPFRAYFEARAYTVDLILARRDLKGIIAHFESWDYYKMLPFKLVSKKLILYWVEKPDARIGKVLSAYQQVIAKTEATHSS